MTEIIPVASRRDVAACPVTAPRGRRRLDRAPAGALACAVSAALGLLPENAGAQLAPRVAVRAEVGAGSMLTDYQRNQMGYDLALQGTLRPAITVAGPVAAQLALSSWMFPGTARTGQVFLLGGGLRVEPRLGAHARAFVDGNLGAGLSRENTRLMFDVGAGLEFALSRAVAVGPVARYGHFVAAPTDVSGDARFWSAGLSLALRFPEPDAAAPAAARPGDADGDGVPDDADLCRNLAAAPQPDPARPGCPLRDADNDGIGDGEDLCMNVPAGSQPDPARRGCPLVDTDFDGVFDPDDRCPTTAKGPTPDPERVGCPDGDDDNDRVRNHQDLCRAQHQGYLPDPHRPGCPARDRDNDAVPDASDACPDRPGAPAADPRRNGCPGLVLVDGYQIRISQPVFFATNQDAILPRSFPVLHAVATALRLTPGIRRMAVEGHTDDRGHGDLNRSLSERRATSVMRWLVEHGVDAARLEAHGFGDARPLQSNRTARGRAANRRVELHIVDPPVPRTRP